IERLPCLLSVLNERACRFLTLLCVYPPGKQTQRVVPERIDLHRLAATRRHHPITDFGIHPGELIISLALTEESILRIDMDPKVCAAYMVIDHLAQLGEKQCERVAIMGVCQVAIERVEEPEGRIRCVVEAMLLALREHIGDEAVAHVVSKGAQTPPRLALASGRDAGNRPRRVAAEAIRDEPLARQEGL